MGKDWFTDFAKRVSSFEFLVQSIYHEYVHAEQHLGLFERKNTEVRIEDELISTYATMINKGIPTKKNNEWTFLIGLFECCAKTL